MPSDTPQPIKGNSKSGTKCVTWPVLVTLLGGFFAFILTLLVQVSQAQREYVDQNLNRVQEYILHTEGQLREDIRVLYELRDNTTQPSPTQQEETDERN